MTGFFSTSSATDNGMYAPNADFTGSATPAQANGLQTNGQLWVGSTAVNAGGTHINVGSITSPSGTLTVGYSSPNITLDLAGGSTGVDSIQVDVTTGAGVNPVVPTGAGLITISGGQYAQGTFGTRVVSSVSDAANQFRIELQQSSAVAAADPTRNGISHFDSTKFSVGATGFVTTSGTGVVNTLSDDVGTVITPAAGNIQLVGHVFFNAGAGTTHTVVAGTNLANINPMSSARWIVDPLGFNGTHTTITNALAAAFSGETIFLMPGTYTENLTLKAGVNISAYVCDADTPNVTIVGKLTATFAGTCTISGIRLQTNSDNLLAVTGSAATIVNLISCYINCSNNTGILNSSSGGPLINLYRCNGNLGTTGIAYFSNSGNGTIKMFYGYYDNTGNSTTASTCSGTSSGALSLKWCNFVSHNFTMSSSASVIFEHANVSDLTFSNTSSGTVRYCSFGTVTVNVGTTVDMENCLTASSSTNVISGAGTAKIANIIYVGTGSGISATTQSVYITNKGAYKVTLPAGDYTVLATDEIVGATSSAARAITLNSSPSTGQVVTIKDITGSAASNNITITPAAGNVDGAGTKVIASNYGSVTLWYSGTAWFSM